MAVILGAWLVGAVAAVTALTWGAHAAHFRLYGTHQENWWFLYTVPAGMLFGGLLAVRLLRWTARFESAHRWPGGSRRRWGAWVPVAFAGSLLLLLGGILCIGRTLSLDQGYLLLFAVWLLLLVFTRPPSY